MCHKKARIKEGLFDKVHINIIKSGSYIIKTNAMIELYYLDLFLTVSEYDSKNDEYLLACTLKKDITYYARVSKSIKSHDLIMEIKYIRLPKISFLNKQLAFINKENGVDINLIPAWLYSNGTGIRVGILDTGIDYNHSSLKENVNIKLSYNFVHNTGDTIPYNEIKGEKSARNGHGTEIAGILGGCDRYNNYFRGIAPKADLISLKIAGQALTSSDSYENSIKTLLKAIIYAKNNNIKILNCSFSFPIPSIALYELIRNTQEILFVTSSGNNSEDLSLHPLYPASYNLRNILVVAACTKHGEPMKLSNFGGTTDIFAPGEEIFTTFVANKFIYCSGTSIAAAIISGIAALIWSYNNLLTAEQVADKIRKSKKTVNQNKGKVEIADAFRAIFVQSHENIDSSEPKNTDYFNLIKSSLGQIISNGYSNTNELIIKMQHNNDINSITNLLLEHGYSSFSVVENIDIINAYIARFENSEDADACALATNNLAEVCYIEPAYKFLI